MLFIQYPPCSTCQKAKKWLDGRGVDYEDRHIKEDNPTYEELKAWYEQSGLRLGLMSQTRQSADGEYLAVYYDANAQRFLLDHLFEILQTK